MGLTGSLYMQVRQKMGPNQRGSAKNSSAPMSSLVSGVLSVISLRNIPGGMPMPQGRLQFTVNTGPLVPVGLILPPASDST